MQLIIDMMTSVNILFLKALECSGNIRDGGPKILEKGLSLRGTLRVTSYLIFCRNVLIPET